MSLHPSLKTSLHIFEHTIKPVLLYGSEIWGIFNPASAKFRNGISLNKNFNNIEPDELHIKFAKFILGVNRKSTNFAVMSELGRIPFYLDIVKAVLKYWYRLEHFDQTSLLFNALECSKEIDRTHNSWYSTVRQFSNLDLPLTSSVNMRQSWVRYPVWQHTFVSPSAFSRRAVVSYWRKYVHEVLVNRLGGLSLPRKSVVRLTDRPDMTVDVHRGR